SIASSGARLVLLSPEPRVNEFQNATLGFSLRRVGQAPTPHSAKLLMNIHCGIEPLVFGCLVFGNREFRTVIQRDVFDRWRMSRWRLCAIRKGFRNQRIRNQRISVIAFRLFTISTVLARCWYGAFLLVLVRVLVLVEVNYLNVLASLDFIDQKKPEFFKLLNVPRHVAFFVREKLSLDASGAVLQSSGTICKRPQPDEQQAPLKIYVRENFVLEEPRLDVPSPSHFEAPPGTRSWRRSSWSSCAPLWRSPS